MTKKHEKTLFYLFIKQIIWIAGEVIAEAAILLLLFAIGLNAGVILPANDTENYLVQAEEKIARSEPFQKELMPENCEYGLYDLADTFLMGNTKDADALLDAVTGEVYKQGYKVIKREDGYCIIHYNVQARFANAALNKILPYPEVAAFLLFCLLFLVTIAVNAFSFGRTLRKKLNPLLDEIAHIKEQDLLLASTQSDIKEFNEVLAALNDMKTALAASLKKEWETEQRRRENISALAHDIKTPVTVIKGNAQLLKEETDLGEIYGCADVIDHNADKVEQYIRLLINETKGIDETKEMQLEELFLEIREQSESLCKTKQIPILVRECTLTHGERQIRNGEKILRAVLNIVDNALAYTNPEKGIMLSFGEQDGEYVKVEDFGTGFSKEALLHGVEQFYTENKERSGEHYGLGLYFTKTVAEESGGRLVINNKEDGEGAEVTFSFGEKA